MAEYRIQVARSAAKEIEALTPALGGRILAALEGLALAPRPRQSRKLAGSQDSYRLRVGAYRVLYQIDDASHELTVFAIGHRRDVYR